MSVRFAKRIEDTDVIVESFPELECSWAWVLGAEDFEFVSWPANRAHTPLQMVGIDLLVVDLVRRYKRAVRCPWCGGWHSADDDLCHRIPEGS